MRRGEELSALNSSPTREPAAAAGATRNRTNVEVGLMRTERRLFEYAHLAVKLGSDSFVHTQDLCCWHKKSASILTNGRIQAMSLLVGRQSHTTGGFKEIKAVHFEDGDPASFVSNANNRVSAAEENRCLCRQLHPLVVGIVCRIKCIFVLRPICVPEVGEKERERERERETKREKNTA